MMQILSCTEAAKAVNGIFYGSDEAGERLIKGVAIDSRKIEEGWMFVAIPGERVDGHTFIPQVLENKAVCAVSEKKLEGVEPYILVKSTAQALKDLAEYYCQKLDIKVIGITGSVGKTSTKEMIAAVLSQKYSVQKTAGNFNNEIGLPLTVFSIGTEHEIAVLEMGISDFGEMKRLARIAKPDYMVITNIGQCHLENLKTRDGILKAKTECFTEMNDSSEVILNGDDDKLSSIGPVHGKLPHYFSRSDKSREIYASDVKYMGFNGSSCQIHIQGEAGFFVHIPLPGEHMVINALAAALTAKLLGLTNEQIAAGIQSAEAMNGRGKLIRTERFTLIDSCYNANPGSVKAELDLLALADTRKVALLGDMLELGEDEAALHYEVGSCAVGKDIDVLICVGRLCEHMAEGAKASLSANKKAVYYFPDKAAFLEETDSVLKRGDTILVKASQGSGFKELLDHIRNM